MPEENDLTVCNSNIQTVEEYTEKMNSDFLSLKCDNCPNFDFSNGLGICKKFSNVKE